MSRYKRLKEKLQKDPSYIEILKAAIEYEKENLDEEDPLVSDTDYEVSWKYSDIGASPQKLYQLETCGALERVFDSNSTTAYSLDGRDDIESLIDGISEKMEDGMQVEEHDFPDDMDSVDGIFDRVIGYDEVKWLLKRGITTDKITNFLLVGPPGSAKTVFLLCINRELGGSEFIPAMDASSSGFLEVMFEERPKYVLFDELDDMPSSEQKHLSSYTENGIVKETKYGKTREMKTNAKTFASANHKDDILDHIVDRFTVLHFDKYTRSEFIEVCVNVLPMEEGKTAEESRVIAESLWENNQKGDVREAIQVARLSRGDPEKVIEVLDDYSASDNGFI